jgi:hypothetical protein
MACFCDLRSSPRVAEFLARRPLSRTTVSAPESDKWRRLHGEEMNRIFPTIAVAMRRLGYEGEE